jgi:CRISPR/Cas system-associated exonuclease Cas4 (RecB family)
MQGSNHGLSKSRIASFEQCPRKLWLEVHNPEAGHDDDQAWPSYERGHVVGGVARSLIKEGLLIDTGYDLKAALEQTAALIKAGNQPLFEATFEHDNVLVRVDLLLPVTADGTTNWKIVEVKSTTGAKDHHVSDLATQLWVVRQAGLPIADATIRHINRGFVLEQHGVFDGLFTDADVAEKAEAIAETRAEVIASAKAALSGKEPQCSTGVHCDAPYPCAFKSYCFASEPTPPEWPISELPNTGRKVAEIWAAQDIFDLRDMPDHAELGPLHQRIRAAVVEQTPHHDIAAIRDGTSGWRYPRTWLDFETISFPIPRWIGTHAWQAIQFQFSAHVELENGHVEHIEALDLTGDDPRLSIVKALLTLPETGAVIAWNASFERRCLNELADAFPAHAKKLLSLAERLVDPMPLVRAHYYHPDMRGSFSIKKVLPTLVPELAYDDLDVGDGMAAQRAYVEAIAPDCTPARRAEIDKSLRDYCGRDSWAMLALCRKLCGLE